MGIAARAWWHEGAAAPKPADAAQTPAHSFDPDGINGPIEAWLVRGVGRMGRAVLRLMTTSPEAGAADRHLLQSLMLIPFCLLGAYVTMAVAPVLIGMVCIIFSGSLDEPARAVIRTVSASLWVAGFALYRVSIWGCLGRAARALHASRRAPVNTGDPISNLLLQSQPVTRGDSRYPLSEIYAVGFNDAVLLPTFYTLLWTGAVGALAFLEGLALGLWSPALVWAVVIAVPAITELYYLILLMNTASTWTDYRRSRLREFLKFLVVVPTAIGVCEGLGWLIFYVCQETLRQGEPWIGWLGAVNMLLVFDVALYMSARWMYVRRRFDAERRNPW